MMWYYGNGGGWSWVWMTVMMVVFWGGLIALVVWAIRSGVGSRREDNALEILRRRLAAGEISQEDFEKTKRALQR